MHGLCKWKFKKNNNNKNKRKHARLKEGIRGDNEAHSKTKQNKAKQESRRRRKK